MSRDHDAPTRYALDVNVTFTTPVAPDERLDKILSQIGTILKRTEKMAKELDDLTEEVTETNGIMQSATVLIQGIAERISAAGTDPAKLQALTQELSANSDALAQAVQADSGGGSGSARR